MHRSSIVVVHDIGGQLGLLHKIRVVSLSVLREGAMVWHKGNSQRHITPSLVTLFRHRTMQFRDNNNVASIVALSLFRLQRSHRQRQHQRYRRHFCPELNGLAGRRLTSILQTAST